MPFFAKQTDWKRLPVEARESFLAALLLPALRDDYMRRKTLDNFEDLKSRKRARYSSF